MELSARNQLNGTVVDVTKGQTTSHVRIDLGGPRLMASITAVRTLSEYLRLIY